MRQQNDPIFSELLCQAQLRAFTHEDITNFNCKMIIILKLDSPLNNIVIVQYNKTRYLIN